LQQLIFAHPPAIVNHCYHDAIDAAQPPDDYVYDPLPHNRAIWLIQLQRDPAQLHGFSLTLRIASLDDAPPFCALSYTWKSDNIFGYLRQRQDSDPIMSPVICDGRQLTVTQNAVDFLSYAAREELFQDNDGDHGSLGPALFRVHSEQTIALGGPLPHHVWIDAICISQTDVQERSSQVAIMGDIYQQSRMTIVWFGKEDPHFGVQLIMETFIPRFNALYRAASHGSRLHRPRFD